MIRRAHILHAQLAKESKVMEHQGVVYTPDRESLISSDQITQVSEIEGVIRIVLGDESFWLTAKAALTLVEIFQASQSVQLLMRLETEFAVAE